MTKATDMPLPRWFTKILYAGILRFFARRGQPPVSFALSASTIAITADAGCRDSFQTLELRDLSRDLHCFSGMTENTAAELNLVTLPHRASASVWDRQGWDGSREPLTLARWLVGIGGAALAVQAIRQRTVTGAMLAGLGGTLAWWALTGEGDLSEARRWFGRVLESAAWRHEDVVHEASADSFPASDPPAFTPTVGAGLRDSRRSRR